MIIKINNTSILESLEFINMDRNLIEVPIREDNNKFIVSLESLSEFADSYSDFQSTISKLCIINELNEDDLLFSAYDSTILEDTKIRDWITNLPNHDNVIIYNRLNETNDTFIRNTLNHIDSLTEEMFQGRGMYHGVTMDAPDEIVQLYKNMNDGIERDINALFHAKNEDEFNTVKNILRHMMISDNLSIVSRRHHSNNKGNGSKGIIDNDNAVGEKINRKWIDWVELEKYPKSKIAQAIQKLRGLYAGIMHKWQRGRDWKTGFDDRIPVKERTKFIHQIKDSLKRVASSILLVIDKLLRILQKGADKASDAISSRLSNSNNINTSKSLAPA